MLIPFAKEREAPPMELLNFNYWYSYSLRWHQVLSCLICDHWVIFNRRKLKLLKANYLSEVKIWVTAPDIQ